MRVSIAGMCVGVWVCVCVCVGGWGAILGEDRTRGKSKRKSKKTFLIFSK